MVQGRGHSRPDKSIRSSRLAKHSEGCIRQKLCGGAIRCLGTGFKRTICFRSLDCGSRPFRRGTVRHSTADMRAPDAISSRCVYAKMDCLRAFDATMVGELFKSGIEERGALDVGVGINGRPVDWSCTDMPGGALELGCCEHFEDVLSTEPRRVPCSVTAPTNAPTQPPVMLPRRGPFSSIFDGPVACSGDDSRICAISSAAA